MSSFLFSPSDSSLVESKPSTERVQAILQQIAVHRKVSCYGHANRNVFVLILQQVTHLFWGVWAIIQAAHSALDFDYLTYLVHRLGELKRLQVEGK